MTAQWWEQAESAREQDAAEADPACWDLLDPPDRSEYDEPKGTRS
jgi:hypothetical protein